LAPQEDKPQESEEPTEYELPKKFQGKSMEDIVGSYENLEKELGRKGSEIGELRRLTDGILKQQITTPSGTQETQEDEIDFFDDPDAAVTKAINNHPKFREFEEQQKVQVAQATTQKLEAAHPDFLAIVQDTKFQEWVQESPIRTQLYVSAHNYDYDSANELLGNWKERSLIANTTQAEAGKDAKRNEALKAGKGVRRTSSESTAGKKIYRRADLIRLKQSDPQRYEALQDEILSAYADGRVK
jgi:flagellar motor switch/type III secretory pathway protein FliN